MTEAPIYSTLNGIFRDVFDDDEIELTAETSARDIPEWDSFAHINIIAATEQKLGVKFTTTEIEALKNVGDFVRLIAKKTAK